MAAFRVYPWLIFSIFVGVTAAVFYKMTTTVPDNYMDEIFHVPQIQSFCRGIFEWDPMITTLPGLYVLTLGLLNPIAYVLGINMTEFCTTDVVRAMNVLYSVGNCYIIYELLSTLKDKKKGPSRAVLMANAVTISTMPVLYFFSFLYYTDQGATFMVLLAYIFSLRNKHISSALVCVLAVFFRQSNIAWVVFIAGSVLVRELETDTAKHGPKRPATSLTKEVSRYFKTILGYFKSLTKLGSLILKLMPYVVVVLLFFCFMYWNNGLAVGDRSSHEASLNLPQLFYYVSFTTLLLAPYLITVWKVKQFLMFLKKYPLLTAMFLLLSLAAVHNFTYVHKYLISDNRHYIFYIWKNIFQRHWSVKYILCLPYIYGMWSMSNEMSNKSILWKVLFSVTLVAALVPWQLMEFRYFILPYLIFRLHLNNTRFKSRLLLEMIVYTTVNVVTFYVYMYRPFTWPDVESWQRFMW